MAPSAAAAGDDSDVPSAEGHVAGAGQHERRGVVPAEDQLAAEDAPAERGAGSSAAGQRHRQGVRGQAGRSQIRQLRGQRPQDRGIGDPVIIKWNLYVFPF